MPVAADIQDVEKISAGYNNSAAIKTDMTAWAWGDNSSGQVGNLGNGDVVPIPVQVLYAESGEKVTGVRQISVGANYMNAILLSDKSVLTWGKNLNATVDSDAANADVAETNTGAVALLSDIAGEIAVDDVIMTAGAEESTVILKTDGSVWALGGNAYGQLGDGTGEDSAVPVEIGLGRSADTVVMNSGSVIRKDEDGNYTDVTEVYSDENPMPYEISVLRSEKLVIDVSDMFVERDPGFNLITGKYTVSESGYTYKSLDESIAYVTSDGEVIPTDTGDSIYLGTTYIVVKGNDTGATGIIKINVMPMDTQYSTADTVIQADSVVYPQVASGGKTMAAITDSGVL
ncbi:MAG: hypothetical protein LIO94_07085 [Clostridiales bacterium]|nr:hypothetical protein [Clostridiales bacterium]